jgi:aspartate/methionine/tyrosine aminotransferase
MTSARLLEPEPEAAVSRRAGQLAGSAIVGALSRCRELHGERAVNLAAGIPEWPPDRRVLDAGARAVRHGPHEYAHLGGAAGLRAAVARRLAARGGAAIDPGHEVTITTGATAGLVAALLAVADPGDEVIVFEPCYESHLAACALAGVRPRAVRMRDGPWTWDADDLRRAATPRTRAVLVNTPHNPSGRVLSRSEMAALAGFAAEHDLVAICDETYEAFVWAGEHVGLADLPGVRGRAITIGGLGKAYGLTGWRVGWVVAPPSLTAHVRKVHDCLTAGGPHPLQTASEAALGLPAAYYDRLRAEFRARGELLVGGLRRLGMRARFPEGAYYVFADISALGFESDVAFADHCVERAGVAVVPGSAFYVDRRAGRDRVRVSFCAGLPAIERGLDALTRVLG